MKHPFKEHLIRLAQLHAQDEYPKESCGFITKDDYIALDNIAEDPINDFRIRTEDYLKYRKEIKAIMHSHADYPHLSKQDMLSQIQSRLPWGVTLLNHKAVVETVFWGDDIIYPLLGRQFVHGCWDCWALVRDYWRHQGYNIMDFPRDNLWWEKEKSMLENGAQEAGFDFIDESELQVGDVIFMKVLADVTNHSAIYLGNGLMIHHLYNRLSRKEPIGRWSKFITGYLRYRYA